MNALGTRDVLAAAYPGRNPDLTSCLTHAVEVDTDGEDVAVLCGRVRLESLCGFPAGRRGPPTCPACARRAARWLR